MLLPTQKTVKRALRYIFFVALLSWILIGIYVGYQYVWFSSQSLGSKWGTFVEGIFNKTSYLPYLGNEYQSLFYQGLLFDSCLRFVGDTQNEDLCTVTTTDHQTYTVSLKKWAIWSDGTPVSIDDIFFTYDEIIRNNKWNLNALDSYKDLIISKNPDATVKVSFDAPAKEHILFFGNYILPQHILKDYDLASYKSVFWTRPVYTNCANVVGDSKDPYSLIFNLANCPDTNLNFYQIKNTLSFDNLRLSVVWGGESLVDAYVGVQNLPGYQIQQLMTNKLVTVFFNTRSDKLRVRTRRWLGGLIKHNFYSTGYELFMKKNTDWLFDVFQSTGANIQDLINRDYSEGDLTTSDLLDINIPVLPSTLSLQWPNQKLSFFVDSGATIPLTFSFAHAYDKTSLEYKGKSFPLNYSAKTKTANYIIGSSTNNRSTWVNKYLIYGYIKKQKQLVASLDIYNMIKPQESQILQDIATPLSWSQTTGGQQKIQLRVLYYDSPLYNFVVERMKNIFKQAEVIDNFTFEKITTPEELQGRLLAGDYDVLVSVVDMGEKKDFTKLFGTDKSQLNPSQYQNQRMSDLLKDYLLEQGKRQLTEINSIYSKDMPFVILGNVYSKLNIKPMIIEKLFGTGTVNLQEATRRNTIYSKLKLVTALHIDGKKVRSTSNFIKFLKNSLK